MGAGPGDVELLTLRAAAVLQAADIVFHDRLVSPGVLARAAAPATLVDVGHRAGSPGRDIPALAQRMAEHARRGEVVVRLKGGDPFVFGRGTEELIALAALDVACEVVPGVSSALAGPAAAGIPATHRGLAGSVVIVSGHSRESGPDWTRLRGDTTVVLMGSARLDAICAEMVAAGWDPGTPAAVVVNATTAGQRSVVGRLDGIARLAGRLNPGAPSILVVGAVAALAVRPGARP